MIINIVSSPLVIQCLLPMNNYQKQLNQINKLRYRPTLLLHVCCGVCSVYPLIYLRKYFKITIFFSNSNIYPYDEFLKRLKALEDYLNYLNDKEIKLIVAKYDYQRYRTLLEPFKEEPEMGKRCNICYALRMEEGFKYALKNHYEYFTTVMSISNRKNAKYLNEIGEALSKKYPEVIYLHADFKKGDGINKNIILNSKLNLYHQNYCGCEFSYKQKEI